MTRSGYSPLPSLPKSPLSVCLPRANELDGMKNELARLQEENKTPGRKGSRKEEIEELRIQTSEKERQYHECIANNPTWQNVAICTGQD